MGVPEKGCEALLRSVGADRGEGVYQVATGARGVRTAAVREQCRAEHVGELRADGGARLDRLHAGRRRRALDGAVVQAAQLVGEILVEARLVDWQLFAVEVMSAVGLERGQVGARVVLVQ